MSQIQNEKKPTNNGGTPPKPPTSTTSEASTRAPRVARKVFIVASPSGTAITPNIIEFASRAEAEKFLNSDPAAPKDFRVFVGTEVLRKQKISLR